MGKYVKIPSNFFDYEIIKNMDEQTIVLYLHMLLESHKKPVSGNLSVGNIDITDDVLSAWFCFDNISEKLKILEENGLIVREQKIIRVIKFWQQTRDRNTQEYKNWRIDVFKRDNFTCQSCGSRQNIQAHHKNSWKDYPSERHIVSNGITLCKDCHLKAHGGRWK